MTIGRALTVSRRIAAWAAWFGAACAGLAALVVLALACFEPLPPSLDGEASASSVRVLDRHGRLVRELRTTDGRRTAHVRLADVSPHAIAALLAVEDGRFRWHPGLDPLAIARAAAQAIASGRVVSGGSTLTQQLARRLVPRPRTLWGKMREAAVALRIEASLDKDEILTEYLNRIEFGPNLTGIEAASRRYFDKPARVLDLAEAATLVALVRGPGYYDPRKGTSRLERRRNLVLERLRRTEAADEATIARALRQPLRVRAASSVSGAEHFAFALGADVPGITLPTPPAVLETTLDLALQRDVEAIARLAMAELTRVQATALSVLVVDNPTGDVLAYVGSPDYFAERRLGANDGARALRQPGSTLKPFVYAAAMERFGWTPATLVSDLSLELSTPEGAYVPRNYDGREHGPVRLRVALANSLNLPALRAAAQVGPSNVMSMLERFGFESLDRDPDHYGAAIALGDGEVRLTELAAAYAALARDGEWRPLRFVRAAHDANGRSHTFAREPAKRVLSASIARQLTSILADDRARRPSFGADSVLSFAFPAAAKTGTSKGFRDNWAVGYTRELTVAVWAGNFDGRPMVQSSGVSGAGPVFHAVLERAMRGRRTASLVDSSGFVEREICPLSGALPAPACPHRVREHFLPDAVPHAECRFHERIPVDVATGERTTQKSARTEMRSFERYFDAATRWAQEAGRPVAPPVSADNGR